MTDSEIGKTLFDVPLFPLNTVLFPEGPLPLRVFEARYLDMVSACMRDEKPFGVVLIRDGQEAGAASFESVGTLARIVDWYQGSDGILGITAVGHERFRVAQAAKQDDGLNVADIQTLPAPPFAALPSDGAFLAEIVKGVINDLGKLYAQHEPRYNDADWVACRLAEVLPIASKDKQRCLESNDPLERLSIVRSRIKIRSSEDDSD